MKTNVIQFERTKFVAIVIREERCTMYAYVMYLEDSQPEEDPQPKGGGKGGS
jgi:hypothetical protein